MRGSDCARICTSRTVLRHCWGRVGVQSTSREDSEVTEGRERRRRRENKHHRRQYASLCCIAVQGAPPRPS
jgi:hypothetical protein